MTIGTNYSSTGIPSYDTVAVLKTVNLQPGELVTTKGYTTNHDGQPRTYLIKTAAQATSDGDTIDTVRNFTLNNANVAIMQKKENFSVTSYAALLALSPSNFAVGDIIKVTDAGIAGDFIVASGSVSDDGGIKKSNATWSAASKYLLRQFSGYINVKWFGAVGDNSTNDTTALQNAINYANSLYVGGSFLGGGATLFLPAGRYKTAGLIMKNGVNIQGEGKLVSQLRMFGDNATCIAASATPTTMTSSGNLYYGSFRDFGIISWEGSNSGTPVNQIGWNAIGFSRWLCENMYFGFGAGSTGISVVGAKTAGTGGPAQWYNSFYGCQFEKSYAGAGGVGALLGDTSSTLEQITTWYFYGGAFRGNGDGTGTGLNLQSCTGVAFNGVTFEANANAILLGSADGTRFANSADFISCYWEGNTSNWNVYAGCTNNSFIGGFQTGGTFTDNGSYTRIEVPGATKYHIQGATANDYWQVKMANGSTNRPKFIGSTFPCIGIENAAGTELIIANNSNSSSASTYMQVLQDDGTSLIMQAGTSSAKFQAPTLLLNNSSVGIYSGAGTPEAAVTAPVGSIYLRNDGGAGTSFYVKQSGSGNTGWVGK